MENPSSDAPRNERWSVGARSEIGYTRGDNQDRMSRVRADFGEVFTVSDGMGGHNGGAAAAQLTVAVLEREMTGTGRDVDVAETVRKAFVAANAEVYAKAHLGDPGTEGMGATALMLVVRDDQALLAHVGDSRAYLFRAGRLRRLTVDHTRVQRMIDAGMLTAAEAEGHPEADLLDRAMGHLPDVEVEVGKWMKVDDGDELMLCSDGLSGYVDDAEIEAAMAKDATVQALVDDLVGLSLAKGGNDNVTVQIVRYGDPMSHMSPGRMMLFQAAFLPLSALVAGITSYAVVHYGVTPSLDALHGDVARVGDDLAKVSTRVATLQVVPPAPSPTVIPPPSTATAPPAEVRPPIVESGVAKPATKVAPAKEKGPSGRASTDRKVAKAPKQPGDPAKNHPTAETPPPVVSPSPVSSTAGTPASAAAAPGPAAPAAAAPAPVVVSPPAVSATNGSPTSAASAPTAKEPAAHAESGEAKKP